MFKSNEGHMLQQNPKPKKKKTKQKQKQKSNKGHLPTAPIFEFF